MCVDPAMRVDGSTPNANEQECGPEKSPGYATSPLFTIAYGARTLEQFLAALQLNRIEYLIDVRTAPYSKFKPEFSRELLQHHVERAGLHYLFMGDLLGGQPKDLSTPRHGTACSSSRSNVRKS